MSTGSHRPERAVLVCVRLPGVTEAECVDSLAELARLVETLGLKTVATLTQPRPNLKSPTVIGEGKLVELSRLTGGSGEVSSPVKRTPTKAQLRREGPAEESGSGGALAVAEGDAAAADDVNLDDGAVADKAARPREAPAGTVIFDCELTPSQMRKLEDATAARVLDRTGVIIEIFSRHARTRAARLQVEIARLAYLAPRLRETGPEDRQGGGIGAKGAGESRMELDRRKIRDRMKELRDQLGALAQEDEHRRERRSDECTIALVGYTNAGKSSMMRGLTGSPVLIDDKLFATLDTTVRPMKPLTHPRILVTDTVGFIQKLPHNLVASFRSTLEEARHASFLVYVVDASDRTFRKQLAVTREVLGQVGAGDLPSLVALNKADRLGARAVAALKKEFPEAEVLSVHSPGDLKRLRERLLGHFEKTMVDRELFVAYSAKGAIRDIREAMRVLGEEYTPEGVRLKVRAHAQTLERIARKIPPQARGPLR